MTITRKCSFMRVFNSTILTLALCSCQHESKFNLDKNLYQFSEKMENGDTLKIKTNLSQCTYFAFEEYTFIKQNDSLYVEKHSEEGSRRKQTLPKILYKIRADNPLSFENYFKYLKKSDTIEEKGNWPYVSITYKKQRKNFYKANLRDSFEKMDSLQPVRKNIYPKDTFLHLDPPPPSL